MYFQSTLNQIRYPLAGDTRHISARSLLWQITLLFKVSLISERKKNAAIDYLIKFCYIILYHFTNI